MGPVMNYLRDLQNARVYGGSSNAWANEQARIEKELERQQQQRRSSPPKANTGWKVICTDLVRQGLFDRDDYLLGARHVEKYLTGQHMRGYHAWALPVVRSMRRSRRATAFWCTLARATARRNRPGALLCAIGHPVCYLIGGLVGEQD